VKQTSPRALLRPVGRPIRLTLHPRTPKTCDSGRIGRRSPSCLEGGRGATAGGCGRRCVRREPDAVASRVQCTARSSKCPPENRVCATT
jgi:hypothetical protein